MEENKSFLQKYKGWVIAGVIIVLVVLWAVGAYNGFITQNEKITAQWSQVENQYQRRFDLIPNIVATVKGVAGQEQKVFGDIAEARTRYAGANSPDEKAQAATQVESALGRLLVIAENYPVLQSSQAYRDLIVTLEGTENRISVERMNYNNEVRQLNTRVKRFPTSILASIFGISERTYFEVSEEARQNPTVDFSNQ
jgi:LemA protein